MARPITDPTAAATFARVIASDLSLYHEDRIAQSLRDGRPFADLEEELVEARMLFLERVPATLDPLPLLVRTLAEFFGPWAAERGLPAEGLGPGLAAHLVPTVAEPLALTARAGLRPGGQVPLGEGTIVVGRAPGVDVQIDLASLEGRHAKLTVTNGHVAVEDLGSAVGTFVNGERITTANLALGDTLQLGTVVFEVVRAQTYT
jgi:hypothetical protein